MSTKLCKHAQPPVLRPLPFSTIYLDIGALAAPLTLNIAFASFVANQFLRVNLFYLPCKFCINCRCFILLFREITRFLSFVPKNEPTVVPQRINSAVTPIP